MQDVLASGTTYGARPLREGKYARGRRFEGENLFKYSIRLTFLVERESRLSHKAWPRSVAHVTGT
jgi:hypothetical protein